MQNQMGFARGRKPGNAGDDARRRARPTAAGAIAMLAFAGAIVVAGSCRVCSCSRAEPMVEGRPQYSFVAEKNVPNVPVEEDAAPGGKVIRPQETVIRGMVGKSE